MNCTTIRTSPNPINQSQTIILITTGTKAARWEESVYLVNLNAILLCNVLQLHNEITMSQVRHFTPPTLRHSLQVQILQANQVVTLAKFVSQLPLEIGTLVHDVLIQSLQLQLLSLAVVAAFLALREVARPAPKLL